MGRRGRAEWGVVDTSRAAKGDDSPLKKTRKEITCFGWGVVRPEKTSVGLEEG